MEEFDTIDPEYLKGFNEGYELKKHLPDLADQLADKLGDTQRSQGFKDGREEMTLEREREHYPKWLRSDRLSALEEKEKESRDKDKNRDKDSREPERDR